MRRGVVTKSQLDTKMVLERKMLGALHFLAFDRKICIGCSICVKVCPEEALELSEVEIQDQKLLKKGVIDIDAVKCTLCGICVVLCPANAIEMQRNGKKMIPVIEAEVFPNLLKDVVVDPGKCDPSCELVCEESCPAKAINVTKEKTDTGQIVKILDVNVDKEKCIFCAKCELKCPQIAIRVVKPFQGFVRLNKDLCPEKCQVCVDICPSKCISLDESGKSRIEEGACIYCGSCQEVCPKKAIKVERTRVFHTSVSSGAWLKALEKLISQPYLVKESSAKSMRKLRDVIRNSDRF